MSGSPEGFYPSDASQGDESGGSSDEDTTESLTVAEILCFLEGLNAFDRILPAIAEEPQPSSWLQVFEPDMLLFSYHILPRSEPFYPVHAIEGRLEPNGEWSLWLTHLPPPIAEKCYGIFGTDGRIWHCTFTRHTLHQAAEILTGKILDAICVHHLTQFEERQRLYVHHD